MKQVTHELSRKTLCWVGLAHIFVLILLAFGGKWLLREPREDFIPLIGLPDQTNPREGTPMIEGSTSSGKPGLPPGPAAVIPRPVTPPEPVTPAPPRPVAEQKIPEPPARVKDDFPAPDTHTVQPPKPYRPKPVDPQLATTAKPSEIKPKKAAVNVDVDHVVTRKPGPESPVKSPSENNTDTHAPKTGGGGGTLNASDVENKLAGAVGGRSGTTRGTGNSGTPGVPGGSVAGDAYKTLIKITLEKHWTSPVDDTQISTVVRIRIDADASVHFLGIQTPSGNQIFDDSVVQAVQATKRMPSAPPPTLGHPDYETTVRFRPKGDI